MTNENPPMSQSDNPDEPVKLLRGLAHVVRDESLSELSLEEGGMRFTLKSAAPGATLVPATSAAPTTGAASHDGGLLPIVSPMVGVFYRSPSPSDPHFVEVGDHVAVGQVIGVVEAMKVFNEITSPVAGRVLKMAAENGALVSPGEPLIYVG